MCGAAETLEGRDDTQTDLHWLERWTLVEIMKFNKAKYKVLHLGQGNSKQRHSLGGEWLERSSEEDLRV